VRTHLDPCRRCGEMVYREDLVPASKVLKRTARGGYCKPCAEKVTSLNQMLGTSRSSQPRSHRPRPF
jgi:hypothetical protein